MTQSTYTVKDGIVMIIILTLIIKLTMMVVITLIESDIILIMIMIGMIRGRITVIRRIIRRANLILMIKKKKK